MHLGRSAFRDAEASHCSSQGRRDYIGGSARLGVLVRLGTDTSWSIVSCCLSKEWRVTIPASRFVLFNDLRSISQVPSAAFVMHDRWTTDGSKYKRSNLCAMQSTINNTIKTRVKKLPEFTSSYNVYHHTIHLSLGTRLAYTILCCAQNSR